ncbi:serine/threonine protein kinase, partial [Streptomyces sp. NPDC058757]
MKTCVPGEEPGPGAHLHGGTAYGDGHGRGADRAAGPGAGHGNGDGAGDGRRDTAYGAGHRT